MPPFCQTLSSINGDFLIQAINRMLHNDVTFRIHVWNKSSSTTGSHFVLSFTFPAGCETSHASFSLMKEIKNLNLKRLFCLPFYRFSSRKTVKNYLPPFENMLFASDRGNTFDLLTRRKTAALTFINKPSTRRRIAAFIFSGAIINCN